MSTMEEMAKNQLAKSQSYKDKLKQSDAYKFLNHKQFEAVTYPAKSFLVLAGAGAGKTSVLINRIRYAIEELNIDPKRIMAVTFTNRAGKEIRGRLFGAFKNNPNIVNEPIVGTFHSICYKFIRQYADRIGLSPQVSIWDEENIKEHLCTLAHSGYDRPLALMTPIEREVAQNSTFISPHQQVLMISNATNVAIEKTQDMIDKFQSEHPISTRTQEERDALGKLNQVLMGYHNIKDYYNFLLELTSGKKTFKFGDRRLHIGAELLKEIMAFKEQGWQSNEATEKNKKFYNTDFDQLIGHYIPCFMREEFDMNMAIRYMALVVFRDYEYYSKDNHLLDFADLLLIMVKNLKENPSFRAMIQSKFDLILVDEFQDTNVTQYHWLKLMTGENTSVMVVGDDDQSIYGWRGAHPEFMQYFLYDFLPNIEFEQIIKNEMDLVRVKRELTPLEIVRLEQNYRSTTNILSVANDMIALNPDRLGKTLFTKNKGKNPLINVFSSMEQSVEMKWIAEDIKSKIRDSEEAHRQDPDVKQLKYNDFAILYRTNKIGAIASSYLTKSNVPNIVYGGFNFYQRREVKEGLEWLNFLLDMDNDMLFERTFKQIPPTKRHNPFAASKEEQGFITSLIEELNFERKRSNLGHFVDALIAISGRYANEVAVMTGDFSEVDIDENWVSPFATLKGMMASEFHHDKKIIKVAKSIYHYAKFLTDLVEITGNDCLTLAEGVKEIFDRCGYYPYYLAKAQAEQELENKENQLKRGKTTNANKVEEAKKDVENILALIEQITEWEHDQILVNKGFEELSFVEKLSAYLQDVALLTDKEATKNGEVDLVKLMTLHASKGLEFPHVYLISLNEGEFPARFGEWDEERRLFYVGITRAREHLTVSTSGMGSNFFRELNQYCFAVVNDLGIITNELEIITQESPYKSLDGATTGVARLQKTISNQNLRTAKNLENKNKSRGGALPAPRPRGSFFGN